MPLGSPWIVLTKEPEDARTILTSTFHEPIRETFKFIKQYREKSYDFCHGGKTGVLVE